MPKAKTMSVPSLGAVHYQIDLSNLHAHLFKVRMTLAAPAAQQLLRLPVWIPGSYLVREFSKHLQNLSCRQSGKRVPFSQLDKASWQAHCQTGVALEVDYEVYAFDASVRTAWLDAQRGFFNGTSLCLQVPQASHLQHTLAVTPPAGLAGWQLATGLEPVDIDKAGFGLYAAADYDTLVDCPVEMGPFWSGSFDVFGVPHRFVVAGAPPSFDGAQLLADTQAICEAEMRFWHGKNLESYQKPSKSRNTGKRESPIPFKNYLFMLAAVHDGYGGLEHKNSTALIANRKDLPRLPRNTLAPAVHKQPEGYATLLGLISHEYFHTWNVKRLRPKELARYDYTRENYTSLLWFFEGFTSYYEDLLLRRAKRIDNAAYLKLLAKTINQVHQTPGRLVQSVAQSSFDAWVKYYRQDENTPNATVSYYTKGALVGLCLDLTLRAEGATTLDAVMRELWNRCSGGPMDESDLLETLQTLSGRSFAKDLDRWVHSTKELPIAELLERHGVQVHHEPNQIAQQLGLRVKETGGLFIHQVLRGGPAEKAGMAAGDEWIAVQNAPDGPAWRMQALEDLTLYTGKSKTLTAWIARDKRLMHLSISLPAASHALRLSVRDADALNRWLEDSGSSI
jgi:predicted metalloprotease with PDZ domain